MCACACTERQEIRFPADIPPSWLLELQNPTMRTKSEFMAAQTTPYFHKDTLTPPSSSRSPPLAGDGPSTYVARDASLYNARPLR